MQTQVSVSRIIKMTLLGIVLLFAYMTVSATPAHAHGGGRLGAFVLGAVVVDAVLHPRVVYAAPMYVPQPAYVVRPQPAYTAPPSRCYMEPRQIVDQSGRPLYDHDGNPAMRQVQVCEYE